MNMQTQKVTPFLWFENQAEEAVEFYASVFDDAKVTDVKRNGDSGPGEPGSVLTATLSIAGEEIIALNGGQAFQSTPAFSLYIRCDTQDEVDRYWEKLADGGEVQGCGWVTDKYGVTWQVIPRKLEELLWNGDNAEASKRAFEAMMKMSKIDSDALQRAYDGK